MRILDFVIRDSIASQVAAANKEGVIRELVENLRRAGFFPGDTALEVVSAVLKRENLGSTGIGGGLAIPHAKHESVDRLIGTLAVSKEGIPFDSLDGERVYIFVMLISPKERIGDHLRALDNVVRYFRDEKMVQAIRNAESPTEIWELLHQADAAV